MNYLKRLKSAKDLKYTSGQALLIVVVFMGAIMLGISVISGFLFTQRLRTSVDITKSTQAIFAADAGIEAQLYDIFHELHLDSEGEVSNSFSNNASYKAERTFTPTGFTISSLGTSLQVGREVSRQLRLDLMIFGAE